MKKTVSALTALVLFAGVAAGCGNNATNQSSTSSANGNEEQVTLKYWMYQTDPFINANKKLIADYEKAHPNVKIDIESFPWDDYVQKIQAAYIGNEAPDIAQVFGSWVPALSKAGLLAEVPNKDKYDAELYPAALGAYELNGKLYGVPGEFNLENGGILVNTKLYKEASDPTTWDQLMATAKKLTVYENDAPKIFGFDFYGDSVTFLFLSLILQQGGKYWTDDNMVDFNTPEAAKALQTVVDIKTKEKIADLSRTTYSYEDTFKGDTAMTFVGPWVNALGKDYQTTDFKYIKMPSFTGTSDAFAAESGWGEIVSESSEHKDVALDFLQFITNEENSRYWNATSSTIPAYKAVAEDPEYLSQNPALKPSLEDLKNGTWIGPIENRDFFFKQIYDNYEKAVKVGAPVDLVLKDAQQAINDMLTKERSK
ncbi:ABC transporter substrate-binding protein [Paenibacillus montanisoli]|uniref:ABC transporter substrate-binding protein n=1 Tax=Paenibacillus montanisoli TaxID=2081970 RepID=A0A328TWB1_9BACL|nr:ABC transporter substrate-binding protein [Paenibacillus montanisoli]RAP74787.1 ABC transporter substrate-binding protein [Paenibacillus montanisoli]